MPLILIFAFYSALLPEKVYAIGQTTDPIIIRNAVRGNDYQRTMTVINTEKKSSRIGFSADGEVSEWTKFYRTNKHEAPLEYIDLKAGETYTLDVVFSIPVDTPNGKYKGAISALLKPTSTSAVEGSGAAVTQKIDRSVTIEVGGKEVIAFDVSVIPKTYDLAKNENLNIRLIYDNRGNISIMPQVKLRITPVSDGVNIGEKSNQAIFNMIYPYPENLSEVKAGGVFEIMPIEIPTGNFGKGRYVADMSFMEKGKIITEKKFAFSIDVFDDLKSIAKTNNLDKASLLGAVGASGNMNLNTIILLAIASAILGMSYLIFYKKSMSAKNYEKK